MSGRDASGERENGAAGQGEVKLSAPLPVQLTRYAAQHLYAPLRTVEAVPGISPVSLKPAVITSLLPSEPVENQNARRMGRERIQRGRRPAEEPER